MKWILITAAIILFIISLIIFIRNHENDRVTELFATSMLIGIGAALLSMSFVLKSEKTDLSFLSSVTVLHDAHNINLQELDFYNNLKKKKNFPSIPYSRNYLKVKQFYYQEYPDDFKVVKNDLNYHLYHEILTYSIISDLFQTFSKSWTTNVEYINTPTGQSITSNYEEGNKSEIVNWNFFSEKIPYPIFKKFDPNAFHFPHNAQLHVPKGTIINVIPEKGRFRLAMENQGMHLSIEVIYLSGGRSAGEIGTLMNIPTDDMDKCATYTYKVSFSSKIKKWLSGHPNAKLYRKWFSTIKLVLEQNYSYDKYLNETKEWYLLYSSR
jgi:hypothetical protein